MEYPQVTLTMTTCKRPQYFVKTISSFLNYCRDMDLIKDVLIGDDHSNEMDMPVMEKYGKVICSPGKGHDKNLNNLFNYVTTGYVFHLEDDWEMVSSGNVIRECFDVMFADNRIGSVNVGGWSGVYVIDGNLEYEIYIEKKETDTSGKQKHGYKHPGFSLNPGLFNMSSVKNTGRFGFRDKDSHYCFEHNFAKRFLEAGYLRANILKHYFDHFGHESAYELNHTRR